jgi:signal transduction histidine kinase
VLGFLLDQFQDPEACLTEARQLIPHPDGESRGLIQLQGGRVLEGCSRPNRVGEQALGRVFSFRDVTARDQATARFEAEADSRQSLLEAASMVGVVAWCLTRDRLLLSAAVEPLLSLDPEERPANLETLEALIHPEDRDRFHRVLERPRKVPFDLRMRKGDGWLWTRWALVRDPAGYRGVFMDITEQRQREERFAERTRAQGMAALVDSGVRSLRRILGQIQPPPGGFQKGNREALDRVEIFLDRSVLAARVDPDFSQPQDLGGLLAEFQGRTQPELGPDLDLQVELEPGLPRLPIHPDHLRQLLVNLVDNARAAVNGAGTIVVRAGSEPLSRIRPGLFLEVRDDGCGIPPGVRSRMFEPYFTTRDGADGLGLTMVKAIVDSYRGSVACQTSAGQGTSFKLLLPIN